MMALLLYRLAVRTFPERHRRTYRDEMIAAIPRTVSSVVPSARALAGTTSDSSESGVTTRLRLLPPSVTATMDRTTSVPRTTMTRRTEDRTPSFERESPGHCHMRRAALEEAGARVRVESSRRGRPAAR